MTASDLNASFTRITDNAVTATSVPPTAVLSNGQITESHAGNAVTFAVKTAAGLNPSSSDPVYYRLPDGTLVTLTSALSITVPSTATLGVTNGVAFRLWFALFYSSGTTYLSVRNCSTSSSISKIQPFRGDALESTVTVDTSSDSSGISYTSTGLTDKPGVLIGFAEYNSGLSTAGTWDASPTRLVNWSPGMMRPGDIVQHLYTTVSSAESTTSATFVATTDHRFAISLSIFNGCLVRMVGTANIAVSGTLFLRMTRGTANNTNLFGSIATISIGSGSTEPFSCEGLDFPRSTSATYTLQIQTAGGITGGVSAEETSIVVQEIVG